MKDVKSALNGVQTVVLDLDGTLYDKRGLAHRMVRRLWWCLPLMIIDRKAHGALWRWAVNTRWHKRIFLPTMVHFIARHHEARPEALAILEECKARGLKTAIYSDYGNVEGKLEALGIDKSQFALLVSAPELGALKPSKACAQKVLEMLHADPKTTLFVGDRDEKDGESARAVGAKFLLID